MWKDPPGQLASRLIERAGLKGKRFGAAEVSTKNANFVVNRGGAGAADVLALIDLARQRVQAQFGVTLEPEIRIVGE